MADLTFKGTTQQVLTEIASGSKIDANTQITITDNLYTAADLLTIVATSTNYPVTLQKTAAAVALSDTATNLLLILNGVNKYTGPVTSIGTPSADNVNEIASLTTGKVTATLDPTTTIDQGTVADLRDVKATDNITFAPTAAIALSGNADINALISLNKILKTDFSGLVASTITGGGNDVAVIKQALAILKDSAGVGVTIAPTNQITAADANALAKASAGALTATLKSGSVAATLKALTDVSATDALAFTTTDTSAKASDIVALSAKLVGGTFTATSITTVTGAANEVATITAALTALTGNEDVNVSGTITAAQAQTIKGATTGDITATIAPDTAAILDSKLSTTTATDMLALTVNGTTAAADDLVNLIAKTGGKIKLDATTVSGLLADVQSVYITNKASFTALGNENIIIDPAGTPTAAQLNAIAAATTGKVTATLDPTQAINATTVADLKDVKASDNITFISTNGGAALNGKDELNALLAIKKIIPNANFVAVKDITGVDAKDAAIVKNVLKLIDPTSDITFNPLTELSAKDANDIAKLISGNLTATLKGGSVAATLKALTDVDVVTGDADALAFTTTDKTASAKDIVALDAKLGTGTADFSNVKTVTGTAADAASGDIAAALALATVTATNPEVKITGTVDPADIKTIIDATTGKVTATLAADTASNLAGYLVDASVGQTVSNAINVTVDDGALSTDAADLQTIETLTSSKVKVDSKIVNGDFTEVNDVYIVNKAKFTGLGNEDITLDDASVSALNVDVIAKATTGVLTATVSNATANILVSQLKNANAKDDLTITVLDNAAGTSAKDLLALTKKTALQIDATAVTSTVSGTAAEINNLIKAESLPGTKYVDLGANPVYNVSGTAKAADANAIALTTGGVVTANIAADTAEKLNDALTDATVNAYTLTVNGATAEAATLEALNGKTTVAIKVDAKEVTGTLADVTLVYVTNKSGYSNLENENIKISNTVAATATNLNDILAATTGVVTATVAADTATNLVANVANATSKDALTLVTTNAAATAAELLALDDKTSVKVNATAIIANGITGSSAELKKLVASKGVELAKDVNITLSDLVVKAADVSAVAKATSGVVTAAVEAGTAAALNKALTDKDVNALTLKVNGATATAKDLISLDGKTSAATITLNVGAITGNIDEITKVFVDLAGGFSGEDTTAATISGEITAAQANAITTATSGVVTATIKADSAALLNSTLGSALATDALKLTVNGTTADAAHLNTLDGRTSVTVNAAAIKNIEGTATAVKAAYDANALKTISGLGNETVDLTGAADADVALVKAINDYTTGAITLDTLTFSGATTFNLANSLGDLKGITELVKIDATTNTAVDIINISLNDILAANDGKTFSFDITNEAQDTVNLNIAGWSHDSTDTDYTDGKTFTKGDVTIELTVADVTNLAVL